MQTQYVQLGQTVQFGDLKAAILLGTNGPTSYSQTTRDPVLPPAQGDYIAFPMTAETLSKTYRVEFYPTSTGQLRAGALNTPGAALVTGWTARWFVAATGLEAAASTNLSAESLQFGAFITQL
jgi:hypothetical protein